MTRYSAMTTPRSLFAFALFAALTIVLPASSATALEFFGKSDNNGGVRIVDASGAEVDVRSGDPIGSRPDSCPAGAYYINALESDKAQVVLTDCATGQGEYTVQPLN